MPGNTTTNKVQPAAPENAKADNNISVAEKPKISIPKLSTGTASVKIPSLKDLARGGDVLVEEEEDPYLKGDDKEHFSDDDFLKHWHAYAAKLKAEGKHNVLSVFNANAPTMLRPYEFEVVVGNKVQENLFRSERPYILNYLRTSLKNFSVEVNPRVDEQVAKKRPYTNQEKFQHMAAKNPQLIELKRRFNLDFD